MSQVYAATREGKIQMFRDARVRALACGDYSMARAMKIELANCGDFETVVDEPEMERAVPEKPKRGRRPKPRCEHDMILDRCPDCRDEGMVD